MSAKQGSGLTRVSRGRVLGLAIVAVFALSAVFASAAGAVKVSQTTLTLGDSLTFGYSQQLFNENFPTESPSAFEHGFAQDYKAKESASKTRQLVDLGCPGETTNSLIGNGPLGEELGETSEAPCGYHELEGFPLHTEYGPAGTSQLEAALGVIAEEAHAGTPVTTVTLDIGANDELHSIAIAEAEAYAAAEKAGEEAAYKYVAEAETPGTEANAKAEQAGEEAGEAYVAEAETPGTAAYDAAEQAGEEAGEAYVVEAETPGTAANEAATQAGEEAAGTYLAEVATSGTKANEEAWAAGLSVYYKALEEGKSEEEASLLGGEALEAFVAEHAYDAATAGADAYVASHAAAAGEAAGEAYVASHAEAAGQAGGEAYVASTAEAVGEAAAEKYGAEHGVAEVKAYLEAHATEIFTHIVTNNLKILGTLRSAGYTGKIIAVGGYDPYGNFTGKGEELSGSLTLVKTLNVFEETKFKEAPYDACFANPQPTFNPGGRKEPTKLQEYTNMANTNVTNGKADGPDIHPTPLGYEEMAKIIKKDCGS